LPAHCLTRLSGCRDETQRPSERIATKEAGTTAGVLALNLADFGVCHFDAFRQPIVLACRRIHGRAYFCGIDNRGLFSQSIGYVPIGLSAGRM
jgi:hypothetical protein